MKRRLLSLFICVSLLAGCSAETATELPNDTAASNSSESAIPVTVLDTSAGVLVSDDPADYPNDEIFVGYTDGTFEILSFENDEEVASALADLLEDDAVTLIQPNYSYESSTVSSTDALAAQQWALSNDGSFQMVEEENRYPVYEDPFETPFAPGMWRMPWYFHRPGGMFGLSTQQAEQTQNTSAVAGIDINADEAWKVYNGGVRDVVVALIDTGVDYTHEDLQGVLWFNEDEIADNNIDDDGNGYIDDVYGWNFYSNTPHIYTNSSDDGHGTHGAGTIAASVNNEIGIAGIADSEHIKIMSLKALGGANGSGTTASIIKAIQYAEANGASICNLSLGSSVNDRALYQVMATSSMLFVVAAGNDGVNTDDNPSYPASYGLENIISVANLNYNGYLHSSSNYGVSSVDLAAPGSYILSTTPENNYSYMTGTSMAAPMVTAAAAMLYSHHEGITLSDVQEILLSTAAPLEMLQGSTLTGGMLDLGAAMHYDIEKLSGDVWDIPEIKDLGTAPKIEIQTVTEDGESRLRVQITDPDDDLAATAYSTGILSAEQFQNGKIGKAFTLDTEGTITFSVRSSGIYTFYAVDSNGNESVKSVSITAGDRTPSAGGVGYWMSRPGIRMPRTIAFWP